jgi:hypothetical protein
MLTTRVRHTIDSNLLSDGRDPRHLARQVGPHRVSRRTSQTTRMEGRRVSLTPGALFLGFLSFVYTGPAEYIASRTFARPARPNVPTGAAERATFV